MPLSNLQSSRLKVAIIGAGPAGLGAAIQFAKLPFVDWNLYEQATAIREIGAGISIQPTTWRLLELLGAAKNLKPKDFFRAPDGHSVQHRNGRTGELLISHQQTGIPDNQLHARTHRAKLQLALLKEVDQARVHLQRRLVRVEKKTSGKVLIEFEDGFKDEVDFLVGADGVRSVVRGFAFPNHQIGYIGRTSYRTIVTSEEIATIPDVPNAVTFWHSPDSWLYTCPLGNNQFEITTMTREPAAEKLKVSWGEDAKVGDNARHFEEFAPIVRAIAALPKEIKQYALFAGPRLDKVTAYGSVALVGDASHPLSGAFGAGAGFALEDVFVLTSSIAWAYDHNLGLQDALSLLDEVRGPHYKRLYGILDQYTEVDEYLVRANLGFDNAVNVLVEKKWGQKYNWIQEYDAQEAFKDHVKTRDFSQPPVYETARL